MKQIPVIAILLIATCGCSHPGTDSWARDWEISANATEANVHKDGYIPFGWHAGELGPDVINRPPYEGKNTHVGVMVLHPITINEPSRLRYRKEVSLSAPILVVTASGNVNGDCILRCMFGNKRVGEYDLTGKEWQDCRFDLSEYLNQSGVLELQNVAGGTDDWRFEHCFIDQIKFERK